ncbi:MULTISPECIES: flagellar protein FliT [Bacillus]|uniref:flagellar protein FliT n=1 Tax=Bacillus TaxID=1386 RepID=UPI00031CBAB7|nr:MULTISPECIES: flagellar protein FliT [Bacillus]
MQETLKNCYELTGQLLKLSRIKPNDISDEQYQEINDVLRKREHLFPALQKPSDTIEQEYASKILEFNKEIDRNLVEIKKQIQLKIRDLKKKEKSNNSYLGYGNAGASSYFYDKKQ